MGQFFAWIIAIFLCILCPPLFVIFGIVGLMVLMFKGK
jgi:hypothetical protein